MSKSKGKSENIDPSVEAEAIEIEIVDTEILTPLPAQFEGVTPANAHSQEEVFAALDRVLENRGNVTQTAREMGIPLHTLQAWLVRYREQIDTLAEVKKLELAELLGCQVKDLVSAVTKDKLDKASLRDVGIVAGIFIDKWKDLTGKTSGNKGVSMKIAWKDGSGAAELTVGGQQ